MKNLLHAPLLFMLLNVQYISRVWILKGERHFMP